MFLFSIVIINCDNMNNKSNTNSKTEEKDAITSEKNTKDNNKETKEVKEKTKEEIEKEIAESITVEEKLNTEDLKNAISIQNAIRSIADNYSQAVVNISAESKRIKDRLKKDSPFKKYFGEDWFDKFLEESPYANKKQKALGSGFIISPDGVIVTNGHVVDGAENITVTLKGSKTYKAEMLGVDDKSDIALIKIVDEKDLPYISIENTSKARVGDFAIAIGNPFGLAGSLTFGIVSATGRDNLDADGGFKNYLQTDAPINQGNSGGPLLNIEGKLLGINTAIYSMTGGSLGIGFAVPADIAKRVVRDIQQKGYVERGYLGVIVRSPQTKEAEYLGINQRQGVLVVDVQDETPAKSAGVKSGDVILEVDKQVIHSPGELQRIIGSKKVGSTVDIKILRGKDNFINLDVGVKRRDDEKIALKKPEKEKEKSESFLGIIVGSIDDYRDELNMKDKQKGVVVVDVEKGSLAYEAGVIIGDIIESINYIDIKSLEEYKTFISENKEKKSFFIRLARKDSKEFIVIEKKD